MDTNIQRALNDKLYDKRKVGALEYVFVPLPVALCHLHCLVIVLVSPTVQVS